ncbi:MAG TPA: hypothetical protein VK453_25695 [Micromonosporaceae bacterium]|nr:hypothetical protein [Micromonosporaceae bacterium]
MTQHRPFGAARAEGRRAACALDALARAERTVVLRRYARLGSNGDPARCFPGWSEHNGIAPRVSHPGNDGKVIFNTKEAAEAAAGELARLPGGRPGHAYPCARSKRGHHHIASGPARATR